MFSDLRFVLRQLAKAPGFTATVIATLALSIGACTVIFSAVDSLVIHPLDSPEPDRLVTVRSKQSGGTGPGLSFVSPADFFDWQKETRSFETIGGATSGIRTLIGEGEARRMRTMHLTANYLDVFGSRPALGRMFRPEELDGNSRVVLLGYAIWQGTFGGKNNVLGRTIRLDEENFTVIGVLPENFGRAGGSPTWSDLALPFTPSASWLAHREARAGGSVDVQARLKPGVTLAQAQAELDLLCERLAREYPDTNKGFGAQVLRTSDLQSGQLRQTLWTLLGAVGSVLLIACANVANLLLVRATVRQREISLRTAFGAARSDLIRLLLMESLLLSLLGGAAGTALAIWGTDLLAQLRFHGSTGLGYLASVKLDPRVLGFAFALSAATGLLFGLVPAWLASRCDLIDALKQGARGATEAGSRGRLRGALIVFEIAASLVLLAFAGLLLRSFVRLSNFDPGFDARPLAYANVTLQGGRYAGGNGDQAIAAFADDVLTRLRALPGVESASATMLLPAITVGNAGQYPTFSIGGRPEVPRNERPTLERNSASPDYFPTVGIRVLRGRAFTEHDNAQSPRVAIINETMARLYFPNEDPIGRRIRIDYFRWAAWSEIVGVVSDTVPSYGRDHLAQAYEPYAQVPTNYLHFAVRTSGDPAALVPALKQQIRAVDPNLAVPWAEPMTRTIGSVSLLARQRFVVQLLAAFTGIALVIAIVGIYGIIAYSVSRRTTEIGIRMALGASRADVLRLVIGQGARLVGIGVALGLIGVFVAGRALQSQLFQTSAYDPVTIAVVTLLFAAIATLACWVPARRATKVDPMVALRAE